MKILELIPLGYGYGYSISLFITGVKTLDYTYASRYDHALGYAMSEAGLFRQSNSEGLLIDLRDDGTFTWAGTK